MVDLYQKKFVCPDLDSLKLFGDFDSEKGSQIRFEIEKCHDRPDCKSPEEITEYMQGKYLIVLNNEIVFNRDEFNEWSVQEQAKLTWLTINS